MNYKEYLKTEHWQLLRGAKLQMSSKCENCGSRHELEVHHKFYRASWFDAKISDLKTLCHGCHINEHAKTWERLPKTQSCVTPAKPKILIAVEQRIAGITRWICRAERRRPMTPRLEKQIAKRRSRLEKLIRASRNPA